MNPDILKMIFMNTLAAVIPMFIGAAALIGVISISPIGRLLVGYLRDRRRDAHALEAMLSETAALRSVLGEVVERLDATERRLALGSGDSPIRPPYDEPRTPTPH